MTRPPKQSGSLEQAVARALQQIPHERCSLPYQGNPCTCDRDERIAARVAAAIQGAVDQYAGAVSEEWGDELAEVRDRGFEAALRALSPQEEPNDGR